MAWYHNDTVPASVTGSVLNLLKDKLLGYPLDGLQCMLILKTICDFSKQCTYVVAG